jgi:hypothetical protein
LTPSRCRGWPLGVLATVRGVDGLQRLQFERELATAWSNHDGRRRDGVVEGVGDGELVLESHRTPGELAFQEP